MLPSNVRCGTAGWSYPHWNGTVYPRTKPTGFHALEYLSRYFDCAEINTTFYQFLRPEVTAVWARQVEANRRFLFSAKVHRRFTHERLLEPSAVKVFKDGLRPLWRARKLACLLIQFPWTFRYTEENRRYLVELRRAFHEFPLVAEMRHSSWMYEEALGTLIDHRIGFCNIDQAEFTKAMPPTSFLTSPVAYVRLHGRNEQDWVSEFEPTRKPATRHDYLYQVSELQEWKQRIDHVSRYAANTFVVTNNDIGGKAVVSGLQLARLLGDRRGFAPADLLRLYGRDLAGFRSEPPVQAELFSALDQVA